jgi:hypothetical protein
MLRLRRSPGLARLDLSERVAQFARDKKCFEDVLPNNKGDSDRSDLPLKHMSGKGVAIPKSLHGQHTKSSTINEMKERAIFKIALGDYYDHYYHIPEFKEHVVNYMTRLDFVEAGYQ